MRNALRSGSLLALALLMSSCLWAPSLEPMRRQIESEVAGVEFKKDMKMTLGPVSLWLARSAMALAGDDSDVRQARRVLKYLRKVEVAIYHTVTAPKGDLIPIPRRLQKLLQKKNWEIAVQVREEGEGVWVLYKETERRLREFYVVVLDDEGLQMVRAKGRFDKMVRHLMGGDRRLLDEILPRRDQSSPATPILEEDPAQPPVATTDWIALEPVPVPEEIARMFRPSAGGEASLDALLTAPMDMGLGARLN